MNTIRLSDYNILPNTDITLPLQKLFLENQKNTTFVFEDADYYFAPHPEMFIDYRISNSDVKDYRVLGIWMKDMKNCTICGNGARLWFEGQMQPITLDSCNSIKIENLTINWKKPLVAEGIIKSHSDNIAEIFIDPEKFPHRLVDNWIEFDVGANEWYPLCQGSHIRFDAHNHCVKRATGDGDFHPVAFEEIGSGLYKTTLDHAVDFTDGDIIVLRHNARIHAGIFSEKCCDLTLEDITVHSCGGLGCLAQFCHDLTYRRVHFIPDSAAGRLIASGRDDGMHLTCNSGNITITECTFLGLMDDPINVHGCCVTSDEAVDKTTLRCKYRHEQAQGFKYWAESGDEIAFIDRGNMSRIGTAKTVSYKLEAIDTFVITFDSPLPDEILALAEKGDSLALDNLTHTASFTCTKNRFGSCRARGILVSTPKPVVIADNYFESSGSAILVAGDSNYWFESGECNDVEIRNNIFTDMCLTSLYQFCEGVISVCPVVPQPQVDKPYHKNVRIINNTFDTTDTPVLYAYSCSGLQFCNNRIFKSNAAVKWHPADFRINLRYCVDSALKDNEWIGRFAEGEILKTECCERLDTDL